MATQRFLHMRMTQEDCAILDALIEEVRGDMKGAKRLLYGGSLRRYTRSDVVKMAISEALIRRREERL